MAERKWWSLETLLVVGVVFVAIVILLKMLLARSQTVVQQPQSNPWVALIDASPGIIKEAGGLIGGLFSKHDETPSGVTAADAENYVNMDWVLANL